jgi:hypothetical protein
MQFYPVPDGSDNLYSTRQLPRIVDERCHLRTCVWQCGRFALASSDRAESAPHAGHMVAVPGDHRNAMPMWLS